LLFYFVVVIAGAIALGRVGQEIQDGLNEAKTTLIS